jgi:hypothetical protein
MVTRPSSMEVVVVVVVVVEDVVVLVKGSVVVEVSGRVSGRSGSSKCSASCVIG